MSLFGLMNTAPSIRSTLRRWRITAFTQRSLIYLADFNASSSTMDGKQTEFIKISGFLTHINPLSRSHHAGLPPTERNMQVIPTSAYEAALKEYDSARIRKKLMMRVISLPGNFVPFFSRPRL